MGFAVSYLCRCGENQCLSLPSTSLGVCRWFVMKTDPVAMALFTSRLTRQQLGPLRP